jgi:hypothetical protein
MMLSIREYGSQLKKVGDKAASDFQPMASDLRIYWSMGRKASY